MIMAQCIEPDSLVLYLQGLQDQGSSDAIEKHLSECQKCENRLTDLEKNPVNYGLLGVVSDKKISETVTTEDPSIVRNTIEQAKKIPITLNFSLQNKTIGNYLLHQPIGQGGMAVVYKAENKKLSKTVAVKILRTGFSGSPMHRIERELQAHSKLDHPSIVSAIDAGEEGQIQYLVTEFVDGLDLRKIVKTCGKLSVADACEVIRQSALGIGSAHQIGIIHRDIKPSNIMIDSSGQVKVLDFGLVHFQGWSDTNLELTSVGQLLGTLDYMAPEQAENPTSVDLKSDLYSLGATLFCLLAGRAPFAASSHQSPLEKLRLIANEKPPKISTLRPDTPKLLSRLIQQTLSQSPSDRPASTAHFAEQLEPFCKGHELESLISESKKSASILDPIVLAGESVLDSPHNNHPKTKTKTYGLYHSLKNAALGLSVFGTLFLSIILLIQTNKGQIVVEVPDESVKVEIVSGGKTYQELELKPGANSVHLFAGKYHIRIKEKPDSYQILGDKIVIQRGKTVLAKITRKVEKRDNSAPSPNEQNVRSTYNNGQVNDSRGSDSLQSTSSKHNFASPNGSAFQNTDRQNSAVNPLNRGSNFGSGFSTSGSIPSTGIPDSSNVDSLSNQHQNIAGIPLNHGSNSASGFSSSGSIPTSGIPVAGNRNSLSNQRQNIAGDSLNHGSNSADGISTSGSIPSSEIPVGNHLESRPPENGTPSSNSFRPSENSSNTALPGTINSDSQDETSLNSGNLTELLNNSNANNSDQGTRLTEQSSSLGNSIGSQTNSRSLQQIPSTEAKPNQTGASFQYTVEGKNIKHWLSVVVNEQNGKLFLKALNAVTLLQDRNSDNIVRDALANTLAQGKLKLLQVFPQHLRIFQPFTDSQIRTIDNGIKNADKKIADRILFIKTKLESDRLIQSFNEDEYLKLFKSANRLRQEILGDHPKDKLYIQTPYIRDSLKQTLVALFRQKPWRSDSPIIVETINNSLDESINESILVDLLENFRGNSIDFGSNQSESQKRLLMFDRNIDMFITEVITSLLKRKTSSSESNSQLLYILRLLVSEPRLITKIQFETLKKTLDVKISEDLDFAKKNGSIQFGLSFLKATQSNGGFQFKKRTNSPDSAGKGAGSDNGGGGGKIQPKKTEPDYRGFMSLGFQKKFLTENPQMILTCNQGLDFFLPIDFEPYHFIEVSGGRWNFPMSLANYSWKKYKNSSGIEIARIYAQIYGIRKYKQLPKRIQKLVISDFILMKQFQDQTKSDTTSKIWLETMKNETGDYFIHMKNDKQNQIGSLIPINTENNWNFSNGIILFSFFAWENAELSLSKD